ncbi:DPY30 domain-containing protein 1 isoform X3 [Strigops habroptila]|nr:DPY30 domain-containing protein 1 isoform X3 [Strigops habroptila]
MLERIELEQEREAALVELEMLQKMKEEELMIQQKLEAQRQAQLEQERKELELQNEEGKMQQEDQEENDEKMIAELTDRAGVPNLTSVEELDENKLEVFSGYKDVDVCIPSEHNRSRTRKFSTYLKAVNVFSTHCFLILRCNMLIYVFYI